MEAHREELDAYAGRLAEADLGSLESDELKALLINAYNALTVVVMLDHARRGDDPRHRRRVDRHHLERGRTRADARQHRTQRAPTLLPRSTDPFCRELRLALLRAPPALGLYGTGAREPSSRNGPGPFSRIRTTCRSRAANCGSRAISTGTVPTSPLPAGRRGRNRSPASSRLTRAMMYGPRSKRIPGSGSVSPSTTGR